MKRENDNSYADVRFSCFAANWVYGMGRGSVKFEDFLEDGFFERRDCRNFADK